MDNSQTDDLIEDSPENYPGFDDLLREIFPECYPNDTYRDHCPDDSKWVIKSKDGVIIAFCNYYFTGRKNHLILSNVGVNPAYRRQGHAKSMIKSIIEKFSSNHEILLHVKKGNKPGKKLYTGLGFNLNASLMAPVKGEQWYRYAK